MNLVSTLKQALGATNVAEPQEHWTDIGGDRIGQPLCVVFPEDAAQVSKVIHPARTSGRAVVPAGQRTAYWSPLRVDGAVVLDVSRIRGRSRQDDVITVGAGEPVRALDTWLRSEGFALPVHPDAFGETSVGAMVATGLTSGVGMVRGGIDRWITGLTVVTGTGEILQTGTSAGFADTGHFVRDGLPDPTGLFIGSEGTLGVIVGVSLRVPTTPWAVHVEAQHTDPSAILRVGQALCRSGLCDTFRAVREHEPSSDHALTDTPWNLWVSVDSPIDAGDAAQRASRARDQLVASGAEAVRVTPETPTERAGTASEAARRWQGPVGAHAAFQAREFLLGLDVNTSYGQAERLLSVADAQAQDALALQPSMVRTALYLAPGFVNLGLHTSVPRTEPIDAIHEHRSRWLSALADHAVVPYRLGHAWPPAMASKIEPSRRALLRQFKQTLDPDAVLNPLHPLVAT